MTIESIELTVDEAKQALQNYLSVRGLDVDIKAFATFGYPMEGVRISCSTRPTYNSTVLPQPADHKDIETSAAENRENF